MKKPSKIITQVLTSLEHFLTDERIKVMWIHDAGFNMKVYIRRSHRFIDGQMQKVLDLASIEISAKYQGKGFFKQIVQAMHQQNPYQWLMIENAHNPIIVDFCKKRGFKELQQYPTSYFISKDSETEF